MTIQSDFVIRKIYQGEKNEILVNKGQITTKKTLFSKWPCSAVLYGPVVINPNYWESHRFNIFLGVLEIT